MLRQKQKIQIYYDFSKHHYKGVATKANLNCKMSKTPHIKYFLCLVYWNKLTWSKL